MSNILEQEYQMFIEKLFGGQKLSEVQLTAMRDAFYGGAAVGSWHSPKLVQSEVQDYINRKKLEQDHRN